MTVKEKVQEVEEIAKVVEEQQEDALEVIEIKTLAQALAQAQAEFPAIPMNSVNDYYGSKYASLGDCLRIVQPILSRHDLTLIQMPTGSEGEVGIRMILHHASGEALEETITLPVSGANLAQQAGKAITYLRRYGVFSILGIYGDEDNDGNDPTEQAAKTLPTHNEAVFSIVETKDDPPIFYCDLDKDELVKLYKDLSRYLKENNLSQNHKDKAELKKAAAKFYLEKLPAEFDKANAEIAEEVSGAAYY